MHITSDVFDKSLFVSVLLLTDEYKHGCDKVHTGLNDVFIFIPFFTVKIIKIIRN